MGLRSGLAMAIVVTTVWVIVLYLLGMQNWALGGLIVWGLLLILFGFLPEKEENESEEQEYTYGPGDFNDE